MSSRLATCAACGKLGLHYDLTEEQSAQLHDLVHPGGDSGIRWRFRTLVCQSCAKPTITFWPFEPDVNSTLAALGIPREALHSPKGGKQQ